MEESESFLAMARRLQLRLTKKIQSTPKNERTKVLFLPLLPDTFLCRRRLSARLAGNETQAWLMAEDLLR